MDRALRPRGPLDSAAEIDGAALETLLLQEVRAHNDAGNLGYELSFWRTRAGEEVDLMAYGERGLLAFEVKRTGRLRADDLRGLRLFREEYPPAQLFLVYGGDRAHVEGDIQVLPFAQAIRQLPTLLRGIDPLVG